MSVAVCLRRAAEVSRPEFHYGPYLSFPFRFISSFPSVLIAPLFLSCSFSFHGICGEHVNGVSECYPLFF